MEIYLNIFLWALVSISVGVFGYMVEMSKSKKVYSNIVAAFVGVVPSAFLVYFVFWPQFDGGINYVALLVGCIFGLIAVRLEDFVSLRV